jgi:hypothetical protein
MAVAGRRLWSVSGKAKYSLARSSLTPWQEK